MATRQFIKTISRNSLLRSFACLIGSLYIRFIHATGEWRIENKAVPDKLIAEGKPFITCFWHGRLMMMSYAWPYDPIFHMLISNHADGQLIAKTINHLGFSALEGSTKHGGNSALRAMVRTLNHGGYVGITPDGPRGPRMQASNGAIALAKLSGVPILPLSYSASTWKIFRSWDRLILPSPFAKGIFIWGEPIEISKDTDNAGLELARQVLEKKLTQLSQTADRLTGQTTPKPETGKTTA
jgi:lysophospholipid acyltransferase (LPLAT)-like uncharacterized protein